MGKLPAIFLAIIVIWLAWSAMYGPENATGGLGQLLSSPQYGEADRPTRSGELTDRILAEDEASKPPTD